MSNHVVIFTGPTISEKEARSTLDAVYLPPAKQGDMYSAFIEHSPRFMGLIDGNFENIPAPWHKEILYIMSKGVVVLGSSSMGALRAAELADFGMIGIGKIFEEFYQGNFEDDDEVTVIHGPKDVGYPLLSEAMVNIRSTLKNAYRNKVISHSLFKFCLIFIKDIPYKKRNYKNIISLLKEGEQFSKNEIDALEEWFLRQSEDLKKQDALELLNKIIELSTQADIKTKQEFDFQNTVYWQSMKNEIDSKYRLKDGFNENILPDMVT